jgi:hypothetical protein
MQKSLILILFVWSLGPGAYAQFEKLDTLSRKFKAYREAAAQEKLYVHTSQEFFLTGETMWFKVYVVDGTLHKPIGISKVAYVELIDVNQKSVVQGKINLTENGGQGSFFIPATLLSGNYQIRAYTQWMKNFPAEYFFRKSVTIVNPFITPEKTQPVKAKINVEFFPEGGNLVAGVRSKVAFKISNPSMEGVAYKGFVLNTNGDTLARLVPLKFGLGNFHITPSDSEKYTCVVFDSQGNKGTATLPQVQPTGYAMNLVDSADNKIYVKVKMKTAPGSFAYLFVHARQMVVHAEVKQGIPDHAEFVIDKSKLPEGVSHFTVFNSELAPMCERLFFVRPSSQLTVGVNVAQANFLPRTKVSINLNSVVHAAAVPANLSVSVYRTDSLAKTPMATIFPYLALTSDLNGTVESPEYYFSNDAAVKEATDNLMLTHGWRRFDWKKLLAKKYSFDHVPEFRAHIVKGTVTNSDGTPVKNILAYLASPSKLVHLNAARSNAKGEVNFEMNDFWGQRKLIGQLNRETDSLLTITISDPFSKENNVVMPPFSILQNVEADLQLRSISMQVQDIYYRDLGDRIVNKPKNDSTSFFGKADKTYNLDDYTRFPLLEEVMREYVPDVFVRKRRDGFHFMMVNTLWNKMFEGEPMVMLDGVPVFDLDKMMAFDPRLVKRLEVIPRYFYLGPLRINGVVSYSTYQGDLQGFELDPKAVVLDYEGLQLHREFYSPKYEAGKQRNSRMPDQRFALYWEPIVLTDEKGNKTLEFFTSDVSGKYIVVVEGITAEGQSGSGTASFTVNNEEF